MKKLRVLDLFSGIGGFSFGLERTGGFETVAFCEIEPFQRKVLAKHWPEVPCYEDVRQLTAERLAADGIAVDVICGGFPCQDISVAGKGAGIEGERSGLWSEIARLVCELQPRFVIVENSSALLGRGLGKVLGDLASVGYDAEWECIPAASVGAPHIRDRIWILAYPGQKLRDNVRGNVRHSDILPRRDYREKAEWSTDRELAPLVPGIDPRKASDWWKHQSSVDRTANGLPGQLDRIAACGNAVVPQIPELIGNAILEAERNAA
jgi:DNA (cytosine-5)-methyltransferase 1